LNEYANMSVTLSSLREVPMAPSNTAKWPKALPPLTPEQRRISDEFMKLWHEELPKKYGVVEKFNHQFPVRHSQASFTTSLEIGAGLGEHLEYEKLNSAQLAGYFCNEMRPSMAATIERRFPEVRTVVGDCQERMDFQDSFFDRIIAIHVLEHLPNLPAAVREMHRLINKKVGRLLVVIPTEGGWAYSLARKISAERVYKKNFGGDYSWFYRREHINMPREILDELSPYFETIAQQYFPLRVPSINLNLCIGLQLAPRPT
jgi:SAM-dependent methyltransferase